MDVNEVNGTSEQNVPEAETSKNGTDKLAPEVSAELDLVCSMGLLSLTDLDSRAMDAIKELHTDDAIAVFKELQESNLEHVSNKSAFLCGLIKSQRQKTRKLSKNGQNTPKKFGPDEAKIKEILDRTGYPLDVSTGQRKYGGPPPGWTDPQPGPGHEIYCGKIPKDLYEDTLIPLFEQYGKIWDLRLMMDPVSGRNRGYCFVTFVEQKSAQEAVTALNNFEIKPGKQLKVNASVANVRLFVGNIPKTKTRDEIYDEFKRHTEGLVEVIVYSSPDDPKKKNRGFAFLDFDSHKSASAAKRHVTNSRLHVWGLEVIVDWAEPLEEPDDETMLKVKVLYVRNLKADVTEAELKEKFEPFGTVERVKKVKGYGFIHFTERDSALKAMQELNKTKIGDLEMEISLAKPLSKNKLRDKRKLQYRNWYSYGGYDNNYWNQYPPVNRYGGRGRGARGAGRGNVDYYNAYDFSGDYFQQGYDSYNSYNNYYGYYGNNRYNNNNNSYSNQRRGQHQQSYNDPNQQQWWMNGGYRNWNGNKGSRGMKHQPQQQQQAPR